MRTLYKYLPSGAAQAVSDGNVRVGTMSGYRAVEKFGAGVGDRDEGTRTDWSHDGRAKSGDQLNSVEREAMRIPAGVVVSNNYVEVRVNSPDCYILSFSAALDSTIPDRLTDECNEPYDSCIEVFDAVGLVEEISKKLDGVADFVGIFSCVYRSRRRRHDEPEVHPALLKDPRYQYQAEFRAIWNPKATLVEARFVKIDEMHRFCRLMPDDWKAKSNKQMQATRYPRA